MRKSAGECMRSGTVALRSVRTRRIGALDGSLQLATCIVEDPERPARRSGSVAVRPMQAGRPRRRPPVGDMHCEETKRPARRATVWRCFRRKRGEPRRPGHGSSPAALSSGREARHRTGDQPPRCDSDRDTKQLARLDQLHPDGGAILRAYRHSRLRLRVRDMHRWGARTSGSQAAALIRTLACVDG